MGPFYISRDDRAVPRPRGREPGRTGGGVPVGDTRYRFVQVRPVRFFGEEKVWVGEARVAITDLERTLLDGLSMPQHCGGFAEALHAFRLGRDSLDTERIMTYALRLGVTMAKRLGWALEAQGVPPSELEGLAALPTNGYRTLDPTGPRRGPCNRRWMIQENLPGMVGA